jgi:MscS family membrane protein
VFHFVIERQLRRIAWMALALVVLSLPTYAEENSLLAVDTSSPRATMATLQMLTAALEDVIVAHKAMPTIQKQAHISTLMQKLTSLLDLSEVPPASRRDTARDTIAFLVDVIRRIDVPPLSAIPGDQQFPDVTKPASWTIPESEVTISRILTGPKAGHFLFDSDTVAHASEFYSAVKNFPLKVPARIPSWREEQIQLHGWMIPSGFVDQLPAFMKRTVLDSPVWKILSSVVLLGLFCAFLGLWARLTRADEKSHSSKSYMQRLLLPLAVIFLAQLGSYLNAFQIITIGRYSTIVDLAFTLAWYVAAAWAAWLLVFAVIEWIVESPKIPDQSLDANLLRLMARIVGLLAVAGFIAYGGQDLGIPVVGVLAGLGVGGLSVALAAQSSIENLIGGLNLYADRPIRVGDFCEYAGIRGNVEHIGLRSTRIRSLDRTITSVPNSLLAKVHVTNFSLRDQMLFRHTLDLRYETSIEQLRSVMNSIARYLDAHPLIRRNITEPRVRLVGFGDWSLKVEVYAYVAATDLPAFLLIQQELALALIDLVHRAGTDFAYPSQTVYLMRDTPVAADLEAAEGSGKAT